MRVWIAVILLVAATAWWVGRRSVTPPRATVPRDASRRLLEEALG